MVRLTIFNRESGSAAQHGGVVRWLKRRIAGAWEEDKESFGGESRSQWEIRLGGNKPTLSSYGSRCLIQGIMRGLGLCVASKSSITYM